MNEKYQKRVYIQDAYTFRYEMSNEKYYSSYSWIMYPTILDDNQNYPRGNSKKAMIRRTQFEKYGLKDDFIALGIEKSVIEKENAVWFCHLSLNARVYTKEVLPLNRTFYSDCNNPLNKIFLDAKELCYNTSTKAEIVNFITKFGPPENIIVKFLAESPDFISKNTWE